LTTKERSDILVLLVSTQLNRVLTDEEQDIIIELDKRKEKILKAIIDDYILTGIPVGSRTISKKEGINISSATIRNVMADLEDLGFLEQPHTSAGRVPSDIAYRLYVDKLMPLIRLSKQDAVAINNIFDSRILEMTDVIEKTAEIISKTTNHISVVLAPQLKKAKIKRIQLVKITETKMLVLIVTSSGLVKEKIITIAPGLNAEYLDMLSNMLTDKLTDKTLVEASNIIQTDFKDEIMTHKKFFKSLLYSIHDTVEPHIKKDIILGGAQNIFNYPEYRDVDKAKGFLEVLETKDVLYKLLNQASDFEFSISIGQENKIDEMKECSIVTATYSIGDKKLGSFGVIGPTRMDYPKVISILNHVGKSLNEILNGLIDNKDST